jgi:hypothetical protein
MAEALNWVSRITSVGLMMVLPALGGRWLDGRQGTSYWALIGLVLGLTIGLWQLMQIAKGSQPGGRKSTQQHPPSHDSESKQ